MSKRLPLFYAVTAIFWFALYAYVPYVSPYSELLGADLRFIGLIVGSYGFTQMLIRFPLGILSDRLGMRKIFVLSGLFFTGLAGLVVYLLPHPMTMLLSRSLGGVAAASWVTFAILAASYYPADQASKSMGYINAANAFGRMTAFFLGGLAAELMGVPYAFLLGGAAGLVGLVIGIGINEDATEGGSTPSFADLFGLVRDKQLLCASFLSILTQYVLFATAFGFTPLYAYRLGTNHFQLGMLGVAATMPGFLVSPLAGSIIPRKIGTKNMLAIGFAMMAVGCGLIVFVNSIWQLFAVQIIISTGNVLAYTLLMGLSIQHIPSERRATAMGFFQAVYGLGMFLGPFVTGWLAHGMGLTTAFALQGFVGLFGMAAVFAFAKKGHLSQ